LLYKRTKPILRTNVSSRKQNAFSLVELLLTLVLILCLAAASVFCYTAIHKQSNLDEGVDRLQSVIRFARAEAATTGRKVRLKFESEATFTGSGSTNDVSLASTELRKVKVEWEPDFLTAPGVFQEYTNKAWSEDLVNELVGVEKVLPLDASGAPPKTSDSAETASITSTADSDTTSLAGSEEKAESTSNDEESSSKEFPAITFYPDGSSDSAEIVLASRNDEDSRRIAVRLSGILGSLSSHPVSKNSASGYDDEFDEGTPVDAAEANNETGASYPNYATAAVTR
jgi:Tfp pilus assembly protein FimT